MKVRINSLGSYASRYPNSNKSIDGGKHLKIIETKIFQIPKYHFRKLNEQSITNTMLPQQPIIQSPFKYYSYGNRRKN
jgi:hypothetical protein